MPAKKTPKEHQVMTMLTEFEKANLPAPSREVYFALGRMWRFDLAWPDLMVAVEYEGASWTPGGAHNSGGGYRSDVDKYNEAAILGWCVIRITADMVRKYDFLSPVMAALATRMHAQNPDLTYVSDQATIALHQQRDYWAEAEIGGEPPTTRNGHDKGLST